MPAVIFVMAGYAFGSLPQDGVAWSALHLVFVAVMLVIAIRAARREVKAGDRSNDAVRQALEGATVADLEAVRARKGA